MPDEGMGQAPPQGGAPPQGQGGASSAQGQATGTGGASMPVPNRGFEALQLTKIAIYVQGLQKILADLPAGGEVAGDLRDAISKIAKHVPPGAISQGVQMTEAQRNLMQTRQMGPQQAAQNASQMQQPPGGAPQGGPSPSPMAG